MARRVVAQLSTPDRVGSALVAGGRSSAQPVARKAAQAQAADDAVDVRGAHPAPPPESGLRSGRVVTSEATLVRGGLPPRTCVGDRALTVTIRTCASS